MSGHRQLKGVHFRSLGPDDEEFSVEVHHGDFFYGSGVDRVYVNGKVDDWYDNVKVKYWSFPGVDEIPVVLGYDLGVPMYWLLPEMDMSTGLRLIESDKEARTMKQVAFKVKNYVLFMDHYNSIDGNNWEDIVFNPIASLPKVISSIKVPVPPRTYSANCDDSEDSSEVDFVDSYYDVVDDDDDLFCDNVDEGVVDEGAAKGIIVRAGRNRNAPTGIDKDSASKEWDDLNSDEEELELPESDEEGQVGQNMRSFRPEDLQNPIFKVGMKFDSVEVLRKDITEYSIKNRVEIKMPKNDRIRIKAHCDDGCPWLPKV
ncbi:uncharacterized protein [Miscanthus floridulus]|uniref:uncharacterized protein n=1 Tax=Miscanthus floridulus TaxID=154761 RepID=UPI00345ADDAE